MNAGWIPLLSFPLEWAALALLVAGAIYWERSALSGLGIEGCSLAAMLGLCLGYEQSGSYGFAASAGLGAALLFAVLAAGLLLALRADPAVGSFSLSLVPGCALGLLTRAGPLRILSEAPPPGLVSGTPLTGTYAEDLLANPWLLAAPFVLAIAAFLMLATPYGLRLRAYSETPGLARHGPWQVVWARISGAALGAVWAVPAAAILLRTHPASPPLGLGFVALACAVAARWRFAAAILLAGVPALLRAARPYVPTEGPAGVAMEAAPFLIAVFYLVLFSRRALRASATRQSRLDPDVL